MDDTKKALLSIDIDTAALSQNVANAKAAVADLSAQLKDMKAAGLDSTDAFAKVSEQLKKASDEASKSKEAYKEYATNLKDTANASDKLKESTAKLTNQQGSATGETEKYSKTLKEYGKDLTDAAEKANPVIGSIGETAKAFKAFKEIAGQVGDGLKNYKTNISTAHESAKTFNVEASDGAKAFKALKTGSDIATGGVSGFSKALASTGIGLVIVAVAALMDYLKQFTPLVDAVEQVTAGLSGGFNALGRIVLDLISPLKKLFTDPKQAMVDLVQFLEQNIINRFKALGLIINGIIHLDLKKLTDGVIQLGTGITNATDKIANYSKVIVKAGIDTAKLKGEQQDLARSVESEALKASEAEAKIGELRVKAQTANLAKRKQYLKEIADLESGQAKLHADNINNGVDLAIKDVAIKRALTQQEIALIKSKGTAELDLLQKNGRIYADDVKSLGEALGKKFELQKGYAEQRQAVHIKTSTTIKNNKKEAATADIKQSEDAKNQELKDQKELFDLKQEAAVKAAKNNEEAYALQTEQNKKDLEFELKDTELTATKKLIIQQKYQQNQLELDNEYQAAKLKSITKTTDGLTNVIGKGAKAEESINNQKQINYQQYFSKLSGLFGKHTEAGKAALLAQKAFGVAQIAINTELQVSESITATKRQISDDSKFPFPLNAVLIAKDIALGIVDVASTIQNGVKQTATLNSVSVPGFARGGLYLSDGYGSYIKGPGTGTSDSINARISHGESIINARSTEMFAPILSAINQAGGGRAFNSAYGGNGYALGGLFNGSNSLNDGLTDLANTRALNDMAKTLAANMPRQILVVEDVQASLQNKAMLQAMSNF